MRSLLLSKKIILLIILAIFSTTAIFLISTNTSSPSAVAPVKPVCVEAQDMYGCVNQQVGLGFDNFGISYALSVLRSEVESGGEAARLVCHPIAHKLGSDAGSRESSLKAMLGLVRSAGENSRLCDYGFVHGSLEGYADANGADLMIEIADDMCSEVSSNAQESDLCFHGLGHSIFIGYDYNFKEAIKGCETFKEVYAGTCVSGVVMEWAIHPSNDRERSFDPSDPAINYWPKMCEAFKGQSRVGCLSQVWHALRLYPESDERRDSRYALKYCESTFTDEELTFCYDGVGRLYWADGYPAPDKASSMCSSARDDHGYLTCLVGYASSRGVQYLQAEKTTEVCDVVISRLAKECQKMANAVANGQNMVSDPIRERNS
ncbi:MAG: hypothetical protein ACKOW9_04570 [Candidatus Paceibacterota bacterium]